MAGSRIVVVEDDGALRAAVLHGLLDAGVIEGGCGSGLALWLVSPGLAALVLDVGLADPHGGDPRPGPAWCGADRRVLPLGAAHVGNGRADHAGYEDTAPSAAVGELVARLHTVVGSVVAALQPETAVRLDVGRHSVRGPDGEQRLTPTEFRLLAALMDADGAVLRRTELARRAWPDSAVVQDNTLDQYVRRLRHKLALAGAVKRIQTRRSIGYCYS